jgi:hypothetical protein
MKGSIGEDGFLWKRVNSKGPDFLGFLFWSSVALFCRVDGDLREIKGECAIIA